MAAIAPPTNGDAAPAPAQLADSIVQAFDSILILDFGESSHRRELQGRALAPFDSSRVIEACGCKTTETLTLLRLDRLAILALDRQAMPRVQRLLRDAAVHPEARRPQVEAQG